MKYTCEVCGKECTVENGEIKRECEHTDKGVVANCKAVCVGVGRMNKE